MLAVKEWIAAKLSADTTFTTLIGGSTQLQLFYPNTFSVFPIVTYEELHQSTPTEGFWDELPQAWDCSLQFHIWNQNASTTSIAQALDNVLRGLLFSLDASQDLYEADTKIDHKVLTYSRILRPEEIT